MQVYDEVMEFFESYWRATETVIINPPSFPSIIQKSLEEAEKLLERLAHTPVEDDNDIYAFLSARQLYSYLRLCYRDGFAPILSTMIYNIESDLYDLLLEGKKGAAEAKERILDKAAFLAQEYNWTIYLHSLVTLQRIKRALARHGTAVGGARWAKDMERFISQALANIGATLPFVMPLNWLLEGLVPARINETDYIRFHKLVRELWVMLSGLAKIGFLPEAPVSPEDVGKFYADFTEGTLRLVQERMTSFYHLPVVDIPIQVSVVYGEEAQYTQSVAFFRESGDVMEIYLFKPPGTPFNPVQELHLLFHEGIPGHAYASYLHTRQERVLPVDMALRFTQISGFAPIDTFSVFHEGWAVFAQRIGAELTGNTDVVRYFFVELLSYLERFLVLENIIPMYTVKPHIPRFADPFQFASYFVGYLLWELASRTRRGMKYVYEKLFNGAFPYLPSSKQLVEILEILLKDVQEVKEEVAKREGNEQRLAKGEAPWVCFMKSFYASRNF